MNLFKQVPLTGYVLALSFAANVSYGAPGVIKDRPLFLGFSVQPNIYFVVDDSGSMKWDVTKTKEAEETHPLGNYSFRYQYCSRWRSNGTCRTVSSRTDTFYLHDDYAEYMFESGHLPAKIATSKTPLYPQTLYDTYDDIDSQGYLIDDILQLCAGYNSTAYDAKLTYTPWAGGYQDSTVNLNSNHGYVKWNDLDNDGLYDKGECSIEYSDIITYPSMSTSEKKNYRNWYTYYRKRQNVAKKAIGEVVSDSDARMGLNTIWNRVQYSVSDMTVSSNKSSLLSKVYSVGASNGTPLRSALDNAGKYYKGSSSPIQSEDKGGSCQQNYTILMTDGYWNSDSDWSGPGNYDGNTSNSLIRASDRDNVSNTLADVALKYYATDLKTSLANEVPVIEGKDENSAQHMVTFTVAFGVNGEIVPKSDIAGQKTDDDGMPLYPDQSFSWPTPVSNQNSTIDDVRHAAWNGHGLYLNASNPQSLIDALSKSIEEIESRSGTASSLAFNSTSYRTDAKFFYARFNSGNWSGELISKDIDENLVIGDQVWEASDVLDSRINDRVIVTYDEDSSIGVAFNASSLPSAITEDLQSIYSAKFSSAYASSSDYLTAAVDYLRGDRSKEGSAPGQFRKRGSRLGDIINSSPVYVQGAMSNWPAFIEPGYLSYIRSVSSRSPMLVVGANDGMFHSFNAKTGEENFAFVPSSVASTEGDKGLHYLLDPDYNHRYYVDATPEVADAYINGSWKTIVVAGLGAGGKGIFALDITSSSFSEGSASNLVMWETTLPGQGLGLTYAQPKVVKMNNGKWVAIIANGYHNTVDGKAKVFVVDLEDGSLLKTFDTGIGSLTSGKCEDACNGMSAASIADIDGNGTADFIYAGDVKGNVWAINVASSKSSDWVFDSQVTYSNGVATSYSGSSKKPVYVTEGGRPITSRIVAVNHPINTAQDTYPNQLLFFGTGQFLAEGDHSSRNTEYFYGVMHANSSYENSISGNSVMFSERIIKNTTVNVEGESVSVRLIEPKDTDEATFEYGTQTGQKLGWYIELPESGERVVHHPVLYTDYILFNTLIPESDPCAYGATGYAMAVSLLFGSNPNTAVFDLGTDEDISGFKLDSLPGGISTFGNTGTGQSTFDQPITVKSDLFGSYPDRVSWQELK